MTIRAAVLLSISLAGCGARLEPGSPAWFAQELERMDILDKHVDFDRGAMTAGQLTPEQFARLPEFGFHTVICLRPADAEGSGWEEQLAADRGMRFARLPIRSAAELTAESAARLKELMREPGLDVVYGADGKFAVALVELAAR